MSSKRRQRRRSCAGKLRFATLGHAIHRSGEIRKDTGNEMYAYVCGFCGGAHLGHQRTAEEKHRERLQRRDRTFKIGNEPLHNRSEKVIYFSEKREDNYLLLTSEEEEAWMKQP